MYLSSALHTDFLYSISAVVHLFLPDQKENLVPLNTAAFSILMRTKPLDWTLSAICSHTSPRHSTSSHTCTLRLNLLPHSQPPSVSCHWIQRPQVAKTNDLLIQILLLISGQCRPLHLFLLKWKQDPQFSFLPPLFLFLALLKSFFHCSDPKISQFPPWLLNCPSPDPPWTVVKLFSVAFGQCHKLDVSNIASLFCFSDIRV